MQNKANLLDDQMNVSSFITSKYENLDIWWIGKNKANSNPIKAKTKKIQSQLRKGQNWCNVCIYKGLWRKMRIGAMEKQSQFKPNQSQFPKSQNECKLTYNKGLQKIRWFLQALCLCFVQASGCRAPQGANRSSGIWDLANVHWIRAQFSSFHNSLIVKHLWNANFYWIGR